jgi:ATP-dependent exoDNAse (exonuclease V) alpha subunit
VWLAFAMTINKTQGQSLSVAGVKLESSCFSHGQLYVACSRVGTPKRLYIFTPGRQTMNIVHKKASELELNVINVRV